MRSRNWPIESEIIVEIKSAFEKIFKNLPTSKSIVQNQFS